MTTDGTSGRGAKGTAKGSAKKIVRPYGDTTGDGMVQLSFTLPVPHDKRAEGAALQLAQKMGMDPAMVVHAKPMGPDFTFFVVYGRVHHLVEVDKVQVVERDYPLLSPKEANLAIRKMLRRRLVVVGALTGQGILLVGMMTEAVVTPFLSDRDLALQNVRYVLDSAGNLHEDFHPAPGGFIQSRAHQVLDEAVDLLEAIVAEPGKAPLLEAIGDGTFGLMKRPADRGKGLDGVVRTARDYYNPVTDILENEPVAATAPGGAR